MINEKILRDLYHQRVIYKAEEANRRQIYIDDQTSLQQTFNSDFFNKFIDKTNIVSFYQFMFENAPDVVFAGEFIYVNAFRKQYGFECAPTSFTFQHKYYNLLVDGHCKCVMVLEEHFDKWCYSVEPADCGREIINTVEDFY